MCQAVGQIPTCIFSNPQNHYTNSDNHFLLTSKDTKAQRHLIITVLTSLSDVKAPIFFHYTKFPPSLSNSLRLNPVGETC